MSSGPNGGARRNTIITKTKSDGSHCEARKRRGNLGYKTHIENTPRRTLSLSVADSMRLGVIKLLNSRNPLTLQTHAFCVLCGYVLNFSRLSKFIK